jgi:hypothetical protein
MHKVCKTCGETRQLSEFPRHRNMADGHLSKCKQCVNSYVRIPTLLKTCVYRFADHALRVSVFMFRRSQNKTSLNRQLWKS